MPGHRINHRHDEPPTNAFRLAFKLLGRFGAWRACTGRLQANHRRTLQRVLVFGDSNACWPQGSTRCWPLLLQRKGRSHIQVVNESCNGRTTQFDNGPRNGMGSIDAAVDGHLPLDVIIIALGTNDLKRKYGVMDADQVSRGVERIIDRVASRHADILTVLMTPPPLGFVNTGQLAGAQRIMTAMAEAFRQLAIRRSVPIVDIHSHMENCTDIGSDGVHLSETGRKRVAERVWYRLSSVAISPRTTVLPI